MSVDFSKYVWIPDLDFSKLKPLSDAEMDVLMKKIEKCSSGEEHRKFVDYIEAHPEKLISWDWDISFDEYARRVKAGEYD